MSAGTNLVAGLIGDSGEVFFKKKQLTRAREGYEAVLGRIEDLVEQVMAEMRGQSLKAWVLACLASSQRTGKPWCPARNLFWENKPLKRDLEGKIHRPVYLANDATVAGIAENRFGSSQGCRDAVMFTLGMAWAAV